jgi:hypothetical protein
MHQPSISLAPSLQDLAETVSDFENASYVSCEPVLARFVYHLDEEPLAGFLSSVLPFADFEHWHLTANPNHSSGSGSINWPPARAERVALQLSLCRALAGRRLSFLGFVHEYFEAGRSAQAHVAKFSESVLRPPVRDMTRLTEQRPVPPVLFDAMGTLPSSGDATLDALLRDACTKFRDPAPLSRMEGAQKLWDAWERLKTLDAHNDKRLSTKLLLDQCAGDPAFRALLESEAKELTRIGNEFQIRHFETDRAGIARPEQVDYLFHRLFALVHLLLFTRREEQT